MRILIRSALTLSVFGALSCGDNSTTGPGLLGSGTVKRVNISYTGGNRVTVSPYSVSVEVPGYVDFAITNTTGYWCRLTYGKYTMAPLPPDVDWFTGSKTVRGRFVEQDGEFYLNDEEALTYQVVCAKQRGNFVDAVGSGYVMVW